MQAMKSLKIILLLVLGSAGTMLAADGQDAPLTLEATKQQGRTKSRFLKETKDVTKATDAIPKSNVSLFHESVGPILKKSCLACHGPEKSEGRLRIDQLNPDLLTGPDVERWREVLTLSANPRCPPRTNRIMHSRMRIAARSWIGSAEN